jgi:hypothetical protein
MYVTKRNKIFEDGMKERAITSSGSFDIRRSPLQKLMTGST